MFSSFARSAASRHHAPPPPPQPSVRDWFQHPSRFDTILLTLGWILAALVATIAGTALSLGAQVPADTLRVTLAEAHQRALRANPELLAFRIDTAIARGELRQAGVLPFNPSFEVLGPGGGNAAQPAITQELEIFGQRSVRRAAARAGYTRASAAVANATRLTLGDVDRAFYRLVSAARRAQLADEVLALNQRLATVTQRQLAEGEISRLDFNLAVVEAGRSRSRALAARREYAQQTIELARLLGLPRGAPIAPVIGATERAPTVVPGAPSAVRSSVLPDTSGVRDRVRALDVDSLTALALRSRPDLSASEAATREASARASLSWREALPNLVVRGVWQRAADASRGSVSPGIGLTLPVFNRNQGETQARRAAATQAELTQAALATRVRAEVARAAGTYRSAAQEVSVLESTVLEPARQNRQLLETAYREGKVGLPVLLLIRNQVNDAESEYWTAWLAEREALVALAEATGQNTITLNAAGQ